MAHRIHTVGIKNALLLVCNNLIQQKYNISIFASSYLNEFVAKQCKNVTFADQVFCYSMKFNKHVKIVQQPEKKSRDWLKVVKQKTVM